MYSQRVLIENRLRKDKRHEKENPESYAVSFKLYLSRLVPGVGNSGFTRFPVVGDNLAFSFFPEVDIGDVITPVSLKDCFRSKNGVIEVNTRISRNEHTMCGNIMTISEALDAEGDNKMANEDEVVKVVKFLIPVACLSSQSHSNQSINTRLGLVQDNDMHKVICTEWSANATCGIDAQWAVKLVVEKALPFHMNSIPSTFVTPTQRQKILEQGEKRRIEKIKRVVTEMSGEVGASTFEIGQMPCMPGLFGFPMNQELVSCTHAKLTKDLLAAGWTLYGESKENVQYSMSGHQMQYIQDEVSRMPECYIPTLSLQHRIFTKMGAELCDYFQIELRDDNEFLCGKLLECIKEKKGSEAFRQDVVTLYENTIATDIPGHYRYKPDVQVGIFITPDGAKTGTQKGGEFMNFWGYQPLDQLLVEQIYPGFKKSKQMAGDCEDVSSKGRLFIRNSVTLYQANFNHTVDLHSLIGSVYGLHLESNERKFVFEVINIIGKQFENVEVAVPFIAATGASADNHKEVADTMDRTPKDIFQNTFCKLGKGLGGHAALQKSMLTRIQLPQHVETCASKESVQIRSFTAKVIEQTGICLQAKDSVLNSQVTISGFQGDFSLISDNLKNLMGQPMNGAKCQTVMSAFMSIADNHISSAKNYGSEAFPIATGVQNQFYKGISCAGKLYLGTYSPKLVGADEKNNPSCTSWVSYANLSNATAQKEKDLICLGITASTEREEERELKRFAQNCLPQLLTLKEAKRTILPIHHLRNFYFAQHSVPEKPWLFYPYLQSDSIAVQIKGKFDLATAKEQAQSFGCKSASLFSDSEMIVLHKAKGGIEGL